MTQENLSGNGNGNGKISLGEAVDNAIDFIIIPRKVEIEDLPDSTDQATINQTEENVALAVRDRH